MTETDNGAGKPRVLVVDDSKLMRFSAQRILRDEFDVALAEDGEQAWERIRGDCDVQVVFLDLSMPVLDGFGVLERIRTSDEERINSLPVIIVTGNEDEDARERVLERGATDFITKPFDSLQLRARAKAHAASRITTAKLQARSHVDSVTDLHSPNYFVEKIGKDRAFAARHGHSLALVVVELEGFRELFLKHGKQVANAILKRVADIIRQAIRQEDTAARIGLARIGVSLPMAGEEGGYRLVERLKSQLGRTRFTVRKTPLPVNIRAAVSSPSADRELSAKDVLESAERELEA